VVGLSGVVVVVGTDADPEGEGDGFFAVVGTEGEDVATAPPGFSAAPFVVELEPR